MFNIDCVFKNNFSMMEVSVDYSLCFICQSTFNTEQLACPLDGSHSGNFSYAPVVQRLERFKQLHCLTDVTHPHLHLITSDELEKNRGQWHTSCRKKYAQDKLLRAEERLEKLDADEPKAKLRRSHFDKALCIFCEASKDENLHNMQTLGMDLKLRQMSSALQDDKMLVRLSEGDVIAVEAKYHLTCYTTYIRKLSKPQETEPGPPATAMEELLIPCMSLTVIRESFHVYARTAY